jgi:hypothetical protein
VMDRNFFELNLGLFHEIDSEIGNCFSLFRCFDVSIENDVEARVGGVVI